MSLYSLTLGLVERSNCTIEECLKKVMVQEDWEPLLLSVLFVLQIARHSSTGLSPYRVLYQRDPVLPFQFMDRVNNGGLNSATECFNLPSSDDSVDNNYISDIINHLEGMQHKIFIQASQNIKKAQKQQAKSCNARPGGIPFKVGDKVLKRNMKDATCKAKMRNRYTGHMLSLIYHCQGFIFSEINIVIN